MWILFWGCQPSAACSDEVCWWSSGAAEIVERGQLNTRRKTGDGKELTVTQNASLCGSQLLFFYYNPGNCNMEKKEDNWSSSFLFVFFPRTRPRALIQISNKHTEQIWRHHCDVLHIIVGFCVFRYNRIRVQLQGSVCSPRYLLQPPEQIPSLYFYHPHSIAYSLSV